LSNENKNRATLPATDMEQNLSHATLPKNSFAQVASQVHIRIISYRKLKHDPDGISAKAVIDGIVQAGILADDSTEQVKSVTFESRKSKEEKTTIEIDYEIQE